MDALRASAWRNWYAWSLVKLENRNDRRIIRDRITLLKEKLKGIDKQMALRAKNRGALVRVALVGYTNVGKSTLK